MSGTIGNLFTSLTGFLGQSAIGGGGARLLPAGPPPPPPPDPRDLQVHMAVQAMNAQDAKRVAAMATALGNRGGQFSEPYKRAVAMPTGADLLQRAPSGPMQSQLSGASSAPDWMRGNGSGGFG